jgi:hypothetical protein
MGRWVSKKWGGEESNAHVDRHKHEQGREYESLGKFK